MINFLLGMLVMYLLVGVAFSLDEIFGNGFLDEWFFYLFTWWIVVLCAPFCLIIFLIKKNSKNYKKNKLEKFKEEKPIIETKVNIGNYEECKKFNENLAKGLDK